MTKYVDHINEQNEVIGRVTRDEAHANFLLHRAAHVLLRTSDGRILSQKVKRNKRAYQLRMGLSASGHVDAGDSYETTVYKELEEELGLTDVKLEFVSYFKQYVPGIENEICALYLAYSDGPFTNWEVEAENLYFFTPEELDFLIPAQPEVFTPSLKIAYGILKEKGIL